MHITTIQQLVSHQMLTGELVKHIVLMEYHASTIRHSLSLIEPEIASDFIVVQSAQQYHRL